MFTMFSKRGGAASGRPVGWRRSLSLEALGGDRLLAHGSPHRPTSVRPEVEHLEERAVPAITAYTISAVTDLSYNHVVYVVGAGYHVYSHDNSGWHDLAPGVVAPTNPVVSASVSPAGKAEVFVIGTDHALWKYDGSWHNEGGYCTQISANLNDACYAVGGDNSSPYKWDSTGWHSLGGGVRHISAGESWAADGSPIDVLWAVDNSWQVWMNDGSWHFMGGVARDLKANTLGDSCYALGSDWGVWQSVYGTWQQLGMSDSVTTLGAGVVGVANRNWRVAYITDLGDSVWVSGTGGGWLHYGTPTPQLGVQLVVGNQFAGKTYESARYDNTGTKSGLFYVVAADGTTWACDDYGWHNYGGWTFGRLPPL
jgi:hypothetical protein